MDKIALKIKKLIKTIGKMKFLQVFNNKINHEYSTTK